MVYEPEVDDYVVWDKGEYGKDEGWVYFKCPPVEEKKGFRTNPRYITIETSVKPKPYCEHEKNPRHKMIHTLLLCYEADWKDLQFVRHRRKEERQAETERLCDMYKSQEGRPLDTQ
tara:strand:+ start:7253 stop:7600 length:348 start_codon:yes stop_codon:yes gene_type:complete